MTGPAGLRYQPDFIGLEEEQALISRIAELPLAPFQFGAFEGKRRVISFGWRYDYGNHSLQRVDAPPGWLHRLIARIEAFDDLPPSLAQLSCSEYEAGVGIGWHRDKPHFERIYGLSLGSPCKFRFRRKLGSRWQRFAFDAAPRSLYRMAEEARHQWEHSIPPVAALRYSITFRTMAARG